MEEAAERKPHFAIRKLTIGAASVLLGTSLCLGVSASTTHTETNDDTDAKAEVEESSGDQAKGGSVENVVVDNTETANASQDQTAKQENVKADENTSSVSATQENKQVQAEVKDNAAKKAADSEGTEKAEIKRNAKAVKTDANEEKKADSIDVNLGTQGSKQGKDARVAAHKVQKDNQVNETTFNLNTDQLKNSNNDVKDIAKLFGVSVLTSSKQTASVDDAVNVDDQNWSSDMAATLKQNLGDKRNNFSFLPKTQVAYAVVKNTAGNKRYVYATDRKKSRTNCLLLRCQYWNSYYFT